MKTKTRLVFFARVDKLIGQAILVKLMNLVNGLKGRADIRELLHAFDIAVEIPIVVW
jgi:hypothetical protein